MSPFLRTFLAIELPDSVKNGISNYIQLFRELTKSKIKWVDPVNLHITLKFLGEFDPSHVQLLQNLLSDRLKTIPSFKVNINQMGAFPNLRSPKVIWLGLNYPENFNQIYNHVEDSVVRLGYKSDDRPFSPHLTVGRVRRDLSISEIKDIGQIMAGTSPIFQAEFIVERVIFFKSDLTREGPIYSRLFEVNLDSSTSLC